MIKLHSVRKCPEWTCGPPSFLSNSLLCAGPNYLNLTSVPMCSVEGLAWSWASPSSCSKLLQYQGQGHTPWLHRSLQAYFETLTQTFQLSPLVFFYEILADRGGIIYRPKDVLTLCTSSALLRPLSRESWRCMPIILNFDQLSELVVFKRS
jgi:hypothetical protein